ncbi:hypothetical protein FORC066_3139 [Yersinia enterocolitica]|nr:hypothetical protein FORC065_1341 [Yersinia enterocolitica]UXD30346.1 hypothetical protein FORC066_3139 [Yersinia enterocolitica]
MSLRRKQPCVICNSDIIFPIFCNTIIGVGIGGKGQNVNR